MKVLCLIEGRDVPASRFRFAQYRDLFERAGVRLALAPARPRDDFSPRELMPRLYAASRTAARAAGAGLLALMWLGRLRDVLRAPAYDVVVVQRGLFPLGPPLLERLARALNPRLILDFDDALYLRHPERFAALLRLCRKATAGNEVLAAHARTLGADVAVVPTAVDTGRYRPRLRPRGRDDGTIVLGYIASSSTLRYVEAIYPALERVRARCPGLVVRVVSAFAGTGFVPLPGMECREWSAASEADELADFDIGVMPLPDTAWSQGKCGFKLLQYLAAGTAAVASAVGVNCEIVRDGENGFLARDAGEWEARLSQLAGDAALRARLGAAGRSTVERGYSTAVVFPEFLKAVREVAGSATGIRTPV